MVMLFLFLLLLLVLNIFLLLLFQSCSCCCWCYCCCWCCCYFCCCCSKSCSCCCCCCCCCIIGHFLLALWWRRRRRLLLLGRLNNSNSSNNISCICHGKVVINISANNNISRIDYYYRRVDYSSLTFYLVHGRGLHCHWFANGRCNNNISGDHNNWRCHFSSITLDSRYLRGGAPNIWRVCSAGTICSAARLMNQVGYYQCR